MRYPHPIRILRFSRIFNCITWPYSRISIVCSANDVCASITSDQKPSCRRSLVRGNADFARSGQQQMCLGHRCAGAGARRCGRGARRPCRQRGRGAAAAVLPRFATVDGPRCFHLMPPAPTLALPSFCSNLPNLCAWPYMLNYLLTGDAPRMALISPCKSFNPGAGRMVLNGVM